MIFKVTRKHVFGGTTEQCIVCALNQSRVNQWETHTHTNYVIATRLLKKEIDIIYNWAQNIEKHTYMLCKCSREYAYMEYMYVHI